MRLVFLGTSAATPTAERGLSSIALLRGYELLLFDAGEGMQRNFIKSGFGMNRKMKIDNEVRIPTKRELIKIYGFDVFPNGIKDDCCAQTGYLMDFITHRLFYHNLTMKETIRELEEFLREIEK